MDPDKTLEEIRELKSELQKLVDVEGPVTLGEFQASDLLQLLDRVEAMDEWLTRGGFLPLAWSKVLRTEKAREIRRKS